MPSAGSNRRGKQGGITPAVEFILLSRCARVQAKVDSIILLSDKTPFKSALFWQGIVIATMQKPYSLVWGKSRLLCIDNEPQAF